MTTTDQTREAALRNQAAELKQQAEELPSIFEALGEALPEHAGKFTAPQDEIARQFFLLRLRLEDREGEIQTADEANTAARAWLKTEEGKAANEKHHRRDELLEQADKLIRKADKLSDAIERSKRARMVMLDELYDAAGGELLTRPNLNHPDIDKDAFKAAIRFPIAESSDNLVLVGAPGTGKSRALAYLAGKVIDALPMRTSIAWTTGPEFADHVASLGGEGRSEARTKLKELAEAEFLFFDDFGGASFTQARISALFSLFDARFSHRRGTYITTNFSSARLRELLAKGGGDDAEIVADRLLRRIVGTANDPRAHIIKFERQEGVKG
ncbi:MAG: ATP-binding protein [Terrimicrobiaceae bacterium]